MQVDEPRLHLRQPAGESFHLSQGVDCLPVSMGGGPRGLALLRTSFERQLARPLSGGGGGGVTGLGLRKLGQRSIELGGGARPRRFALPHLVLQPFELCPPEQRPTAGTAAGQEHRPIGAPQSESAVQYLVSCEQGVHPGGCGPVHAELVAQGMPVRPQARPRDAGEEQQRAGLLLGVPASDLVDCGRVAHQHRVEPLAQQPLGELRVAPAGAHEVCQGPDYGPLELRARPEQRLCRGRKAHPLTVELGKRVPARGDLRERLFHLAAHSTPARLALLCRRHEPPRFLHGIGRGDRRARLRGRALRDRAGVTGRHVVSGFARRALGRRVAELLLQLGPLPLEHRPLSLERPQRFRLALEILLQRPHSAAPLCQPVADLLFTRGALL